MKKLSKEKLQKAITLWNWLTRPYVLKSDTDHSRDSRNSRRLLKIINKHRKDYEVKELSNGSLILTEK